MASAAKHTLAPDVADSRSFRNEPDTGQHLTVENVTVTLKTVDDVPSQNTSVLTPTERSQHEKSQVIDFAPNDPEDPQNWSPTRKWTIVVLLSCMTAICTLSTIIAAPVAPSIMAAFHETNPSYRTLLVSIWELGEIFGPLLCGPLSELYGRLPVIHIANTFFVLFSVGAALSQNIQMLIAFRFLTGLAVVPMAIGPGIIGDLFPKEKRGFAMTIGSLAGLIGPTVGPPLASYVGQDIGWRFVFWIPTILSGVIFLLFAAVYKESYRKQILKRRVRRLRRETGNQDMQSVYEDEGTSAQLFRRAVVRPMYLLGISPVLALLALFTSVHFGLLYITLTSIASVFEGLYDFSEGAAGLAFLGLVLGMVTGALFCGRMLDLYVKRHKREIADSPGKIEQGTGQRSGDLPQKQADLKPEFRLPSVLVASVSLPIGLLIYGWTAQEHTHWIAPIIGTAVLGFGWPATSISVRAYIVDAFGIYSVSAVSAMLVARNITATVLPLAGPPLFNRIGLGWGCSVLALCAAAMMPLPLFLMRFGERLRARSKFKPIE